MIEVYGASDDLIEIEGAIVEEFSYRDEDDGDLIAFSNGVVLRLTYTNDGVWRIAPLAGASLVTVKFADDADSENYSDRATIDTDASWVVHGGSWAKANHV